MAARLAWLIDMSVVSEMMRRRPGPRVAGLLDSIADEGLGLAFIAVWAVLDGIRRPDSGRGRMRQSTRLG